MSHKFSNNGPASKRTAEEISDPMPMSPAPPLSGESDEEYIRRCDLVRVGNKLYSRSFLEWMKRREGRRLHPA